LKASWFWLKTLVRYCHLKFLSYALPPEQILFFFLNVPFEVKGIFSAQLRISNIQHPNIKY
jgi:hypothetical protein